MSIIQNIELSLTEVIEESSVIVEVKFLDNFSEAVAINGKEGEADIPPFIKKGASFKVVSVLRNKDNIKVPEVIHVPDENWRRSLSQYKEKHGGKSKSFNIKEYVSDVTSVKKATILFLYHFQGMFELTAKNSFASQEMREKLEILLSDWPFNKQ